jgi:hypothetical protein
MPPTFVATTGSLMAPASATDAHVVDGVRVEIDVRLDINDVRNDPRREAMTRHGPSQERRRRHGARARPRTRPVEFGNLAMNDGSVPLCKYMTTCFPNIRPSQLAMFSTRSFARQDTTPPLVRRCTAADGHERHLHALSWTTRGDHSGQVRSHRCHGGVSGLPGSGVKVLHSNVSLAHPAWRGVEIPTPPSCANART